MRDLLTLMLILLLPVTSTFAGQVEIYRDAWGVPHIYGETPADAMYGFGYVQAQDRLQALLKNYLIATGHMAETFGSDHLETDFRQRLWQHEKISREQYPHLDPEIRTLIEHFMAGQIAFLNAHPDRLPSWSFKPGPHHAVALARYLAFRALERQADREFHGLTTPDTLGNQWAVGRDRSARDAVMLLIDPFDGWHNTFRFYEAHLHGGALHAFGFARPGLPVFTIGHNSTLGWSALPGGPDCADVYEIDLESQNATRYRYDQTWKPIQTDTISIQSQTETRTLYLQRTHHGPIFHRQDRKAYAYRFSLASEVRQIEQLYRQMAAPDLKAFYAALEQAQAGPHRIAYGDAYGNIVHIRTGRVPIRSELHRWDRPVPGNTSSTAWRGVHPQDDLAQIHNPLSGWLQDCDASPDLTAPASSLIPERYPAYILNHTASTESARSVRARKRLTSLSRLSLKEAQDLALDTYIIQSEHWLRALNIAHSSHGRTLSPTYPDLDKTVQILNRWDGRADPESSGATIYTFWRTACDQKNRSIDTRHILSHQPLGDRTRQALLNALGETTLRLRSRYGRLNVYWKEIHRFGRNDRSWALPGSSGPGRESLRTVFTRTDGPLRYGTGGQAATALVLFHAPGQVESYSVVPLGQSDDPASPHHYDQAESLYSQNRFKSTGFSTTPGPGLSLQVTLTVQISP